MERLLIEKSMSANPVESNVACHAQAAAIDTVLDAEGLLDGVILGLHRLIEELNHVAQIVLHLLGDNLGELEFSQMLRRVALVNTRLGFQRGLGSDTARLYDRH